MKKSSKLSLLAGAALLLSPLAVSAGSYEQDVVRDERGNVVVNTWGNCVLTKWEGGASGCAGQELAISREDLTVYFGFNSSALTSAARSKLDGVIGRIQAAGMVDSVSITGFADEIGGNDYNQRLSSRRSHAVQSYLAQNGVDTSGISLSSLGETSSKSSCAGTRGNERKACLWRDRRVEMGLNLK